MSTRPLKPESSFPISSHYSRGEVLAGTYELVQPVGKGGVATVWVAQSRTLGTHVAVKIIELRRAQAPDLIAQRAVREAQLVAQLSHPAVVRMLEFGITHLGDPFIAMELLHGETLAELLQRDQRVPAEEAVRMMLPIADALWLAHRQSVVHRDLKPGNIFLSRQPGGRVMPKLFDFGIARFLEQSTKLTADGVRIGTPAYMSPEQARGLETIDFRSDVWAYAIVLYELMTGARPFRGGSYYALLLSIAEDEPVPTHQRDAGDEALWNILARAMSKDPQLRWTSMREFGRALAGWLLRRGVRTDITGCGLDAMWLRS